MKRFLFTLLLLLALLFHILKSGLMIRILMKRFMHLMLFGDDETVITVVEFWVEFNKDNAFKDWDKLKGVEYYRVDIEKRYQILRKNIESEWLQQLSYLRMVLKKKVSKQDWI